MRCEHISVPFLPHPLAFIVQKKSKVICKFIEKTNFYTEMEEYVSIIRLTSSNLVF